jgi:hypothetical protein
MRRYISLTLRVTGVRREEFTGRRTPCTPSDDPRTFYRDSTTRKTSTPATDGKTCQNYL